MAISTEKSVINSIKSWLFPSVVTILSYVLYEDIKEIKADVKQLLAQSASDHTEIINLKSQVNTLNTKVFVYSDNKPKDSKYPLYNQNNKLLFINQNDENKNNYKKIKI